MAERGRQRAARGLLGAGRWVNRHSMDRPSSHRISKSVLGGESSRCLDVEDCWRTRKLREVKGKVGQAWTRGEED